jgi:hypothetical protein
LFDGESRRDKAKTAQSVFPVIYAEHGLEVSQRDEDMQRGIRDLVSVFHVPKVNPLKRSINGTNLQNANFSYF